MQFMKSEIEEGQAHSKDPSQEGIAGKGNPACLGVAFGEWKSWVPVLEMELRNGPLLWTSHDFCFNLGLEIF
jgi:hypothetical protein